MSSTVAKQPKKSKKQDLYGGTASLRGTVIKIILLGALDAVAVFAGFMLFASQKFAFLIGLTVTVLLINWVYLRKGGLAFKYFAPGLVFLFFFQLYVILFSGYTAFTNYGTTHNGTQEDAVIALKQSAFAPVDEAPIYNLQVEQDASKRLFFIMVDPNDNNRVFIGNNDTQFKEVTSDPGVTVSADTGLATVPGFKELSLKEQSKVGTEIIAIKIPVSNNMDKDGFIATTDGASAQLNKYSLIYKNGTFVSVEDGSVYKPTAEGFFQNAAGDKLPTGWSVNVGFKNFETIFTNKSLQKPILTVFAWTIIFAVTSVLSTFIVGLALALLFNDERMRGKKFYRSLVILPYAFPAFLSAYVWKGLFDTDHGFINTSILHLSQNIPWLEDPTWAKIAVLMANLWLGFPYMFLISTGALQAIPGELTESATIDGASAWQQFRLIKLPLLLVSLAPLLISSFAFNFNNFTIIYLLTGGGPSNTDATDLVSAGGTDILITFVYKIAFNSSQGRDFGLASAFSMLIFIVVGGISLISFRRTRALEDMN